MQPSQLTSDLRTLVARRAGTNRRVAVLAEDQALKSLLEANGCVVLADPPSIEDLGAFQPQVVVAFDGFIQSEEAFAMLARTAPTADLVLSHANAASASTLLGALLGGRLAPGHSEADVRRWLAAAGYAIVSKDLVVTSHEPTGLSADTEAALRQVLEQVNPGAAADRLLLVARRAEGAAPEDARTSGLLSVIISSAGDDEAALMGTLRSLSSQQRRPLELIVASTHDVVLALEPMTTRPGITAEALRVAGDTAARFNAGLARATGQYVAFLEPGDLLEPLHFANLIRRLESGTVAWALSTCRAGTTTTSLPAHFSLPAWLEAGAVEPCSYVVDRTRLGTFALTFAEGTPASSSILFARLALLFPPSWVPSAPTVERLKPTAVPVEALRAGLRARPLRSLATLDELLEAHQPAELGALLKQTVAKGPRARRAFESMEALVRRVQQAAHDARQAAEAERKR